MNKKNTGSISAGFNYGAINPLSIFSFMFGIAIIFHFMSLMGELGRVPDQATFGLATNQPQSWLQKLESYIDITNFVASLITIFLAIILVIKPRSILLLCLLAISQVTHYIIASPNGSNHYIMDTFMSATIVVSLLFFLTTRRSNNSQADFYNIFASSGRFFLVLMYFFGIFHKLNPDFLNPDLSCAVALTKEIALLFNIADQQWFKYAAIWGTFIMEGIAMLLLFSRRWKYWGFVIGIPFHLVVAFSGYRFFIEYSSLAIALYCLFLPQEFYQRINSFTDKIRTSLGLSQNQFWIRTRNAFCVVACLMVIFTIHVLLTGGIEDPYEFIYGMMPLFALYGLTVYGVILYFSRDTDPAIKEPMYYFPQPLMVIFPILFLLNGFGPYLGWKTESSISMFSHIHTEGSRTNHLLFSKPPYIFDYQKKLVKIISSSHPEMNKYAENGNLIVFFELRRFVTENPDIPVSYEMDGIKYVHDENNLDSIQPVPWWLQKVLLFKPVDNNWPKVCSH